MIVEPPPGTKQAQNPDAPENGALHLNPGASNRKPRSVTKLCVWLAILTCILLVATGVHYVVSNLWDGLRHPYRSMYYDKPITEVDWSQVVRPMITRDSKFDVVASVWIRDDTAKDGTIRIDGKDRTERLLYSGAVFHDVHLKSKNVFSNVTLNIPASHFARPNISNYDLRASFVLAQRDKPSWLNFVKNYTSWRPQEIVAPTIRKWEGEPSLEDQIYDSFGITIPLIQFHNVTSRRAVQPTVDETADITTPEDIEGEMSSDEELERDEDIVETLSKDQHEKKNSFDLEFSGERKSTTEHHPYIVTRTHIRVVDETELFKRQPYEKRQKELANWLCAYPLSHAPYEGPQWHQCSRRSYFINGVFETKVQLQKPLEATKSKNRKKRRAEWLYAPFVSTTERAPGPKDLFPIPFGREAAVEKVVPQNSTPDEEHVTVVWKLSFSGRTPDKLLLLDVGPISRPSVYDMTASDDTLEHLQHKHDLTMGLFGHRIHEDVHPRRIHILGFTSTLVQIICWFLTIHYWYTRTSTTGISRFGTTFIACNLLISAHEQMFTSIFRPEATGHWLTKIPMTYVFRLIQALAMLKAAARVEFSWLANAEDSKKKGWIPKVHFAKATHMERASDRVESRVSGRIKLALLLSVFSFFHFLTPSSAYLLRPRIPRPTEELHPLHSLSPHSPTILGCIQSLGWSLYVTGSILQFAMNRHSQTYAGDYKTTTFLSLILQLLMLLDLVPHVVGRSTRPDGVSGADGVKFLILVVGAVQAVRYRNVRSSDAEDAE